MASFTTTVAESLRLFGAAPSNKWQEYAWNAFLWGEGNNKNVTRPLVLMDGGSISPSEAISQTEVALIVAEALTTTGDPSSETLRDGAGYAYVFPNNTTDGEQRDPTSWTSGAAGSTTWTSGTAGSTTWS